MVVRLALGRRRRLGPCSLSVLWGLALATRAPVTARPRPWLLDLHRFLGGLAVVFVAVHLAGLALDPFVSFGVAEIAVPMASSWKPGAVAWGVVAAYLLLAVEITSLLKKRIPARLWRSVHLTSYLLYAFATVHLLLAGMDRTNPVLRCERARLDRRRDLLHRLPVDRTGSGGERAGFSRAAVRGPCPTRPAGI